MSIEDGGWKVDDCDQGRFDPAANRATPIR